MPTAVIAFDFDPLLRLTADLVVRWQTLALAAVIAGILVVSGVMARRTDLRADDLLYIAVGVVPGAVVLGRIGYGMTHADAFATDPGRLLDPASGGLDLALGVVGGVLTGVYVASLLGAPIRRWAHLVALPLVVALGAGKLTMVLGGSGQGLPSDAAWATAFLPPGPWVALAPAVPSLPSQALEGIATLGWAIVLALLAAATPVGRRDGRLLLIAIAGWAALRAAVATTWRDPLVAGPLGAAGWLTVGVGAGAFVVLVVMLVRRPSPDDHPGRAGVVAEPSWPDPETRPPF